MPQDIGFCLFGAGRIGAIHAANLAAHPLARLRYVIDVASEAAAALAARHAALVTDIEGALADADIDAVVIASSTNTHADLVEAAAAAGKAVFCEKPLDLSLVRVEECLRRVEATNVPLQIGFNRRFDPSFAALEHQLRSGRVGKVETVLITSRDPAPPPLSYIEVSGGLFRDMMIHDLDMARWLLSSEPSELYATASCLVDPKIGVAGDVDTAAVMLKTATGAIAVISNSRRAVYGYDQRLEVLGAEGMLRVGNRTRTALEVSDRTAVNLDRPLHFFLERYAESYRLELNHFIACLGAGRQPAVSARDGWAALYLAEAAIESASSGRAVSLERLKEGRS